MTTRMHENELDIDEPLVRRLLRAQFPQWADLPLTELPRAGTDNALFRLGGEMLVRLPRIDWAAGQAEREHRWLPMLAPHLPLRIPTPIGLGEAAERYPWGWSIVPWLPGENPTRENIRDLDEGARLLARFVTAMGRIDTSDGPRAGKANFGRGLPIAHRDAAFRERIAEWEEEFPAAALLSVWERALAAPAWEGAPAWLHGDLHPGNMLAHAGQLSAVIDFGALGVGDPAVEMMPAWNLFDARSRQVFREAVGAGDALWDRGRGWALSMSVMTLPYYRYTNPRIVDMGRDTIAAVLEDAGFLDAGA